MWSLRLTVTIKIFLSYLILPEVLWLQAVTNTNTFVSSNVGLQAAWSTSVCRWARQLWLVTYTSTSSSVEPSRLRLTPWQSSFFRSKFPAATNKCNLNSEYSAAIASRHYPGKARLRSSALHSATCSVLVKKWKVALSLSPLQGRTQGVMGCQNTPSSKGCLLYTSDAADE